MRGLDFRGRKLGICLIVQQPFASERDCQQGLARVGRHGDKAERIKFAGFEIVDRALNISILRELIKFRAEPKGVKKQI